MEPPKLLKAYMPILFSVLLAMVIMILPYAMGMHLSEGWHGSGFFSYYLGALPGCAILILIGASLSLANLPKKAKDDKEADRNPGSPRKSPWARLGKATLIVACVLVAIPAILILVLLFLLFNA